jgi:hypothetical protein
MRIRVMSHKILEIGMLSFGRAFQMVAQVVAIRISTSLLSPQQLGTIYQIRSITDGLSRVFVSPVSLYVMRGFRDWYESSIILDKLYKYIGYLIVITVLSMIIILNIQTYLKLVVGIDIGWIVIIVGLGIFLPALEGMGVNSLNVLYRRGLFIIFTNLGSWAKVGFSAILVILYSHQIYWLFGELLGSTVAAISFVILTMHLIERSKMISKKRCKATEISINYKKCEQICREKNKLEAYNNNEKTIENQMLKTIKDENARSINLTCHEKKIMMN